MTNHISRSIFINFEAYLLLTLSEEEILQYFDELINWIDSRPHYEREHDPQSSDSPLSLLQYQLNSHESFLQSFEGSKIQEEEEEEEETPLSQTEQDRVELLGDNKKLNQYGVDNNMELEAGLYRFYDNNMELEEDSFVVLRDDMKRVS